jgi:hypothetical protein
MNGLTCSIAYNPAVLQRHIDCCNGHDGPRAIDDGSVGDGKGARRHEVEGMYA